ncbi:Thymus-specific serine protease, partial [Tulasnella sp. UAMH 9824]
QDNPSNPHPGQDKPSNPHPGQDKPSDPHIITTSTFTQLTDHHDPSGKTFPQRYFFSDEFWTGLGAPIIIFTPGEQSAQNSAAMLTNPNALIRAIMKGLGAADRYWGNSKPYEDLTTANLKHLTVEQSINDIKVGAFIVQHTLIPAAHSGHPQRFVETVKLPTKGGNLRPEGSPWVHLGCGYAGALVVYTQRMYPNLFAAAWASSAPVETKGHFWQYFKPIQKGMPESCMRSLTVAIKEVTEVLRHGSDCEKYKLKKSFGLWALEDDGDLADRLISPLYDWENVPAACKSCTGKKHRFFEFCDAIEAPDCKVGKTLHGIDKEAALKKYASWIKNDVESETSECCPGGGSHSTFHKKRSRYTDRRVENTWNLQWYWMRCTELGWWLDPGKEDHASIVSPLVNEEWNLQQCKYMFPDRDFPHCNSPGKCDPNAPHGGQNPQASLVANKGGTHGKCRTGISDIILEHGGWTTRTERLFVVNGEFDPWHSASLPSRSTTECEKTPQEVKIIKGGHYCWDWDLQKGTCDWQFKNVINAGVQKVQEWLNEWYKHYRHLKGTEHPMAKGIPIVEFWQDVRDLTNIDSK